MGGEGRDILISAFAVTAEDGATLSSLSYNARGPTRVMLPMVTTPWGPMGEEHEARQRSAYRLADFSSWGPTAVRLTLTFAMPSYQAAAVAAAPINLCCSKKKQETDCAR